jgi:hypothetical protein
VLDPLAPDESIVAQAQLDIPRNSLDIKFL